MADENPFAQFAAPPPQNPFAQFAVPPAANEPGLMDRVADVGTGFAGGIVRGVEGIPGIPGTLAQIADAGADYAARQTAGRLYNRFAPGGTGTWEADTADRGPAGSAISPARTLPNSADTVRAIEGVIGETPRPQTTPGKYAATMGELLGTGVGPLNAVVAGGASEAAGQLTAGKPVEPLARMAAAMLAPALAKRIITPAPTPDARVPLTDALEREGVTLSAGQRTGSKGLKWLESTLSDMPGAGGGAAKMMDEQGRQFNAAVAKRMGESADMLTPDVMRGASDRIGGEFKNLSARNTLRADPTFQGDLANTVALADRKLSPSAQASFQKELGWVASKFQNGALPGVEYQALRSDFSRSASGLRQSDPNLADAYRGLRNALDGAMSRSISPGDSEAWKTARSQYGNMKDIEKAMAGSGEGAAQGYVSPLQLRSAVAGGDRTAYVRGQGDLAELARAGAGVMAPLPQSGTAPRMNVQNLISLLAPMISGGGGAAVGGIPGAIAGMAAPAAVGRVLMSPPAQAYLGNRAISQSSPSTDSLLRALVTYQQGKRRQ